MSCYDICDVQSHPPIPYHKIYDKTPITPITIPPTIPPTIIIDPVEISPNLPAPFNRLVETTAADPLAEAEAANDPVAEGETSGV
jgi:hypothetical protein